MPLCLQKKPGSEKFVWTITNFKRIPLEIGMKFESCILLRGHARKGWRFFLHPSRKSGEIYIMIRFKKSYSVFDPMLYDASFSIKASESKPSKCFEFKSINFSLKSVAVYEILRKDIEKLPRRSVTIECEITEVSEKSFEFDYSTLAAFENLSSDFKELLSNPMHSDLTVSIQKYTFYLHTCMLYARCRNISNLFDYSNITDMPNVVRLDNFDPHIFRLLIQYLYSGKCEKFDFPLLLLIHADKLKLKSLKQCVHEKVQEHRTDTEIATLTLKINWNLKQIQFRKENEVPFVQIFTTACCMTNLAVRMGISENFEGEKYIDVSFMILLKASSDKPVSILCVLTLLSSGKICGYEKGSSNIEPGEEWHFPPFIKLSDIPKENEVYSPCLWLTAEVSLSDGCAYNIVHTKTRLAPRNTPVVYPERLGSDMRSLFPYVDSNFKKHDIVLKTVDDCCIPTQKAILWARWPAIRQYLIKSDGPVLPTLQLDLSSEELKMLLEFIYTGCLSFFDSSIAEKLLQANAKMEYPQYLVKKCEYFLETSVREADERN